MKKTVLTISAFFLLSVGSAFAATDAAKDAVPQQTACSCACKMKDNGQGHSGHMHQMHGTQPAVDANAPQSDSSIHQHHQHGGVQAR